MKVYTDTNYTCFVTNKKNLHRGTVCSLDNLVTSRGKKQDKIYCSNAEAEFQALAQGLCERLWMKIIFDDLKVRIHILCNCIVNNKSTMSIAHSLVQYDRTKYIEIDKHFIKDNLDRSVVDTNYVPVDCK